MHQSIHLLAPSTMALDRYYKVYSTKSSILFAKVGGQFYDESSDESMPLVVGLAMMLSRKLFFHKRKEQREAAIDRQMSENPQSLLNNSKNFDIQFSAINKVEMKTQSTFHTAGTATGTLRFYLNDGSERKFTIPSFVTTEAVAEFFEAQRIPMETVK